MGIPEPTRILVKPAKRLFGADLELPLVAAAAGGANPERRLVGPWVRSEQP